MTPGHRSGHHAGHHDGRKQLVAAHHSAPGRAANASRRSGSGAARGTLLRDSGGCGELQPPPSMSTQIGLVIAYGTTNTVLSGLAVPGVSPERSRPAPSALITTDASSGSNSLAVTTGNMLRVPVTS